MKKNIEKYRKNIAGTVNVPSDKSITHRAFIFAALCKGTSVISNPLFAEDCLYTLKALKSLGVNYRIENRSVIIEGVNGIKGFKQPEGDLYLGNSGTGARLLAGLLAGCEGLKVKITGDASLSKRPMKRIIDPLFEMGACIEARDNNFLPLEITGKKLKGIIYDLPIASAQVKSAVLLAGLYSEGKTEVIENIRSRNHTENMMKFLGNNFNITVPNDISSAAFFIVLGVLASSKGIIMRNVGLNPTRDGILRVLRRMNADIKIENKRVEFGEEIGDIIAKKSNLKATTICKYEIPLLIDEIPVIALAAMFAEGETVIKDAAELRHKESDRLSAIKTEYTKLGAKIKELEDGLIITGMGNKAFKKLIAGKVNTYYDHRIAMSLVIAGLLLEGKMELDDISCIQTSFPDFFECLEEVFLCPLPRF